MASWQDDENFRRESRRHQTVWDQLQRQHAELQLRSSTISTSGPRQFSVRSASDKESDTERLSPHRQYYYSHVNSDDHRDHNPVIDDADSPASKARRFGATFNCARHQVDYVQLNRRQLKGHNNRKFIYPQKTYTEMFNVKKQQSVGYRNLSHSSGKIFIICCFGS